MSHVQDYVRDYVQGLSGINAPYNFVPLNEQVYTVSPEHAQVVSHDLPFRDAISGTLDLEIEMVSPVCAGNDQEAGSKENHLPSKVSPLRLPSGEYAIAGSSLRGMIRSVVEIAAFGRMQRFDDRHLSFRDLAGPVKDQYSKRMGANKSGGFQSLSKPGWLEFRGISEGWFLVRCDVARVSHELLHNLSSGQWRSFERRSTARDKYRDWRKLDLSLQQHFEHTDYTKDDKSGSWGYRCATLSEGSKTGTLVFTGQPGQYSLDDEASKNKKKKAEFIFFNEQSCDAVLVSDSVVQAFKAVHDDSDEWAYLKSPEYQRLIASKSFRVPVFYIEDDSGEPEALGLAMMFRLPYKNTIGDAVHGTVPDHAADHHDDLANQMFGFLSDAPNGSLKSRISIGTAVCDNRDLKLQQAKVILGNPNPGFYPAYLEQPVEKNPERSGGLSASAYNTYESDRPRIRGWKRYPARPDIQPRCLEDSEHMNSVLQLFPAGTVFRSRVRLHNLRPEEAGALIWALDLGGNDALVHSLGMGKPYGYGQIRCRIRRSSLRSVDGSAPDPKLLRGHFEETMESWAANKRMSMPDGWANSDRMRMLRALCNPAAADEWQQTTGAKLAYLTAEIPWLKGNDMPKAHQVVKNQKLVLPAYAKAGIALSGDMQDNPAADEWLKENIQALKTASKEPNEETIWRGKGLAERCQEIADAELQIDVAQRIVAYWKRKDWYEHPQGKSMKKAHAIYLQLLSGGQ